MNFIMNILYVFLMYSVIYMGLHLSGIPITHLILSRDRSMAVVFAPVVALSIFGCIATMLMYYFTGYVAGIGALSILIGISVFMLIFKVPTRGFIRFSIREQAVGYIGGLLFLLPLILTNDKGIFALNGADFGSYAGWGSFFREHTLVEGRPLETPINSTLAGFANLQEELARPGSAWRVGNITLFSAMNALSPAFLWPTFYMLLAAIFIGFFSLSVKMFSRYVMLQCYQVSNRIGWMSLLLNTVIWLGMSHYTPNVLGLSITLLLISLFFNPKFKFWSKAISIMILLGLLMLVYPESLLFLSVIVFVQLCVRFIFSSRSRRWGRFFGLVFPAALGVLLAVVINYRTVPTIARHFKGIASYNRPGDFVGIHGWGYMSQLGGFSDYNSLLNQYNQKIFKYSAFIGYLCFFIIISFSVHRLFSIMGRSARIRARLETGLAVTVLLFSMPIYWYSTSDQWLLVWRSMLTLSPYVWILISIIGLRSISVLKIGANVSPVLLQNAYLCRRAFFLLIVIALVFRFNMIKSVVGGSDHGVIFGDIFNQQIEGLESAKFDYVFIEYEGSGTIQGGWEFMCQKLPFVFPEHGSGRNEYSVDILEGKKIALIDGGFRRVQYLNGFDDSSSLDRHSSVRGGGQKYSDRDNIFIPYSSTWIYSKDVRHPFLVLPGLPGKLLFWNQSAASASLRLVTRTYRDSANLRVSINGVEVRDFSLKSKDVLELCTQFKKGLNVIRFEPYDNNVLNAHARLRMLQRIADTPLSERTEYETGLFNIYALGFVEKNPLSSARPSDWSRTWNLITPRDEPPLNPHVFFDSITLTKRP